LNTYAQALVVHHGEHTGQTFVLFTDQPAFGTVEVHHTGGGTFDTHFVFNGTTAHRSEEHTSELQSRENLVCRLLLEKKQLNNINPLHLVSIYPTTTSIHSLNLHDALPISEYLRPGARSSSW